MGHERISQKFITQLLREQGDEDSTIKVLPISGELNDANTLQKFITDCSVKPQDGAKLWNIILPPLTDLLAYQKICTIFQFLNNLKKCEYVKRCFLWISLPHLQHDHPQYVVAACEYIADIVIHFLSEKELSILICKPGGGVTFKHYKYTKTKSEIKVELKEIMDKSKAVETDGGDDKKVEQLGTFKIELDEDEMVARNAMKMPYEK